MSENNFTIQELFDATPQDKKAVVKVADETMDKKTQHQVENSMITRLQKLLENFKTDVSGGKIAIRDIKDFKAVTDIYSQLTQNNQQSEIPAMPKTVLNFYSKAFDTPDNEAALNQQIDSKLDKLNPNNVSELLKQRQEQLNNENAQAN